MSDYIGFKSQAKQFQDTFEAGRREGFEEGYKTAQEEVENLIQPYRFDPILWDKIIQWASRRN